MKIALFSDIHANLPALEAFFKDADERKPDAIYCLGDLVGYNIWANEIVNEIKSRKIPTITGNYDFNIGRMSFDDGQPGNTGPEKTKNIDSVSFTNSIIKPEERKYLRTLPAHIKVEFQLTKDKLNLLLVHGSPRKNNEYLFEDYEEKSLLSLMEQADADILCFGHTHKPYHRILHPGTASQNHFRHAINTGSVGKPKDNNPKGCYVMLTIHDYSSILDKDSIGVEFIRFDYDIEKAAKAVENSPLSNEYADMLRKAY